MVLASAGLCATVASSCSSAKLVTPAPASSPIFSFIFANDLHVTTETETRYLLEVIETWRAIEAPYDFVVIGGDLVNGGTTEELMSVKQHLLALGKPFYTLPGNHDLTDEAGHEAYRTVFGADRENYLVQHKGFPLVFIDLTNGTSAEVSVPDHTMKWLRSIGRLPAHLPTIVFSHFSLHPDVPRFPVRNTAAILDFFDSRNVLAFFSGHYHGRWHGMRNNARYWGNACLSYSQDNHDGSPEKGYLWVDVFQTQVQARFVEFRPTKSPTPEFTSPSAAMP